MLKSSFNVPERLTEALETKWMRRVAGFYRCTMEDKACFTLMDWEPSNLFFLNCAIDLYQVLLNDPKGLFFIENERKPTLFQDIAKEIQLVLELNGNGWTNTNNTHINKLVFRFTSCSQTLTREYFSFLGKLLSMENGRFVIENETGIQMLLLKLGFFKPLDYLSRAVILGFSFYDRGYYSYELINNWCQGSSSNNNSNNNSNNANNTKVKTNKLCSKELHLFILTILLALLRGRIYDFIKWGVEAVVEQLSIDNLPLFTQTYLLNVIQESMQNPKILTCIIKKKLKILNWKNDNPKMNFIIMRLASCEEGLDYLQTKNLITNLIINWIQIENDKYASYVETSIAKALSRTYIKKKIINIEKIPVVMAEKFGSRNSEFSQVNHYEDYNNKSYLGGEDVNIEGLVRIPWNIEIKLSTNITNTNATSTSISTNNTTVPPSIQANTSGGLKSSMNTTGANNNNSNTSEYLRVDAFLGRY